MVIVNSCTVTDEADRQSRKMVRDLKRKNPNLKIIYTGCGAEVNPEVALKMPEVSAVLGNQDKAFATQLILKHLESETEVAELLGDVRGYGELKSRHPIDREWPTPEEGAIDGPSVPLEGSTFRTRAFLKIQEGCDAFCTYCIIPYGRGPARSLTIEVLVERIQSLVKQGIKEVVLTGTNIGDYGVDWSGELKIDDLLEAILTQTRIERLRIGSLDPTEISDRMIQLMETHEAFCPHFHVSLQHTESKILKLMKRKYAWEEIEQCFSRLAKMKRRPFVGMDVITGFPGETETDFQNMEFRLKSMEWNRLHVFPYSERTGTPATRLPGKVAPAARKSRASHLQALSLERLTRSYAGARESVLRNVLLEGSVRGPDGRKDWISGYSREYRRVIVSAKNAENNTHGRDLRNQVVDVRLNRFVVDRASGEVSWLGEVNHE